MTNRDNITEHVDESNFCVNKEEHRTRIKPICGSSPEVEMVSSDLMVVIYWHVDLTLNSDQLFNTNETPIGTDSILS